MKLPPIECHPTQAAFLQSKTPFTMFSGGRGSAKSTSSIFKAIHIAGQNPNKTGVLVAPTYDMLREIMIMPFLKMARSLKILDTWSASEKTAYLINGFRVLFRSADDPEKLRGPNLTFFGIDEGCFVKKIEDAWLILMGTLRESHKNYAWVTTTPSNKRHYLYKLFYKDYKDDPDYETFHCKTVDNPFVPDSFVKTIKNSYEGLGAYEKRELKGEWANDEDSLVKPEWFNFIPMSEVPKLQLVVRSWDIAVSVKTSADFTASCKMGIDNDDNVYILDATKDKEKWTTSRQMIIDTGIADSIDVPIVFETIAAQLALYDELKAEKQLSGHIIHPFNPSKDKMARALPFFSAMKNGKVRIIKGGFNNMLRDELMDFGPDADHDDVMDAISCSFGHLHENKIPMLTFLN